MAQAAFFSVAGGDGNVYNDNAGNWATVKGLTSGTSQKNVGSANIYASNLTTRSIGRGFFPFDTSSIPPGSVITSATLRIHVSVVVASNGTFHLVQSTQADPTSLADADFDAITNATGAMTSGGSVGISSTGEKTITFNATALGWITPGGYTKLAVVEEHDQADSDPGAGDYRFTVEFVEDATESNRPLLTVNYEAGGEIQSAFFM